MYSICIPAPLLERINTKQKANNMKTNRSLFVALAAVVAIAFAILVAPVSAETKVAGIFGYGAVMAILAIGVIEYGRGSSRELTR